MAGMRDVGFDTVAYEPSGFADSAQTGVQTYVLRPSPSPGPGPTSKPYLLP